MLYRQISMQVANRREDVLHASLSVNMAKESVKVAFTQHGQASSQFISAITRLNRERTRERACTNVLKQLEDAQHMMQMKEMTKSALVTLRLAERATGKDNLEKLLDTTDNEVALADEAKAQMDEIANCFSQPGGDLDNVDMILQELGLVPAAASQPTLNSSVSAELSQPTQPNMSPPQPEEAKGPIGNSSVSVPFHHRSRAPSPSPNSPPKTEPLQTVVI